jgi:hypothetical protein
MKDTDNAAPPYATKLGVGRHTMRVQKETELFK